MLRLTSFARVGILFVALASCAFAFTPPQDAAQKSEAHKRIINISAGELEASAVTRVEPVYPPPARYTAHAGVNVHVLINEQGEVIDASATFGYHMAERGEKLEEALAMIQRAVNADPSNRSYLDSLGWAYFKLGRLDEAERYLTRAAEGGNKSPAVFEHLGDLYDKQGRREEAIGAWQKALSLSTGAELSTRLRAKLGSEPPKEK